jgi:hypothetical protein
MRVLLGSASFFLLATGACASQPAPAPATPAAPATAATEPGPGPAPAPPPPVGESPAQAAATPPQGNPPLVAPPPSPALPPARPVAAILADAVKAMGGEAAFNAHTTKRMKVEIIFDRMGITGSGEELATKANKMLMTTDLPGIGTLREGSNGKIFWAEDPINGRRVLSGAEAEQMRLAASWCPELQATQIFKTIEVKNEIGPAGAPLECLVMTPKEGPAITSCYDASTHLQVLQKGTHATPQGETPFLSVVKDWRDVGGIKMPWALDTQEGPLTFTLRVTDVKYDEPMADKLFELPAAAGEAAPAAPAKGKPAKPKAAPKK